MTRKLELRRMRIAVFAEYLPPKLGSDRRIFEIMKRLTSKHEIHFLVFPPVRLLLSEKTEDKISLSRHLQRKLDTGSYGGIYGHFMGIPQRVALMWQHSFMIAYLLTSILLFIRATRILRKVKPDIIVLNYPSPYTGMLGFLEARLCRRPVLLDFNDLIAQYTIDLLKLGKTDFRAKMLILVQRYLVKHSEKVVVPTKYTKKYALSLGVPEEDVEIVPNGVDPSEFDSNRYDIAEIKTRLTLGNEKICAYCGRMDGWAGVNIILRLCDMAANSKLNTKFLLAGSGAQGNVSRGNVLFLGEIPHERIPSILAVANVVLIPFPRNEVSHAASPLKLFEGMAMRKPVIASRVCGAAEVISDGENGFLADPDNLNEWNRKLGILLESEALALRMGENARRSVEKRFNWSKLSNQFATILHNSAREKT